MARKKAPSTEFYGEDLAAVHDAGFSDLAESAAALLTATLRRQGFTGGHVVDLGCGGGTLLRIMKDAGYTPHGVDASEALVALARKRIKGADITAGSFRTYKIPRAAAVCAVGEVIHYLHDPVALPVLFARVFKALEPGGVFLLDSSGPGRVPADGHRNFHRSQDWFVAAESAWESPDVLRRDITVFHRRGATFRRSDETHRLRVFAHPEVTSALSSAGFRVGILRSYQPRDVLPPDVRVLVAVKPR